MLLDWWSPLFVAELKLAVVAIGAGVAAEHVLEPAGERNYRALGFNLVVAFIFLYLTMLITPPVSKMLVPIRTALSAHIPVAFPDGVLGSIGQTLAFFLAFDFFFYWWHRAQHGLGFLWVQHRFHHQERWVNVTTIHRYHFSEEPLRNFVIYLPLAMLFDFKPVTVIWFWTVFTLWGYWIHANVRIGLGGASRWISGPQFHRHHHAPEYENRNFAAFFPIWDRVFGTYHHPRPGEFPVRTGVDGESDGNSLYEAVAKPFVEWFRMCVHGVRNRVLRPGATPKSQA